MAKVLSSLSLSSALSEDPAESADSTQEGDTPAVPTVPALLPQQTDGHLPDADVADAVQAAVQFPSGSTTRFAYDTDTGT